MDCLGLKFHFKANRGSIVQFEFKVNSCAFMPTLAVKSSNF